MFFLKIYSHTKKLTESPKKGFSLKDVMNNSEAKELSVIVGVYSIIPTQKALSFLRDTSETEKVMKILYALSKEDMLNEVRTSCPKHQGSQDRSEQGAVQQLRHRGKQG